MNDAKGKAVFNEITVSKIEVNPFHLIGKQWMLVTAGTLKDFNTMTAAWGSMGFLWNFPTAQVYVRPQRYTYDYMEKNDHFTLSFFEKSYKNILTYCGSHSGKNFDKVRETGLVPLETAMGNIYFEQAWMVLECKKVYFEDINPDHFVDRLIQRNYPNKDYHRMYTGKVVNCYMKEL